MTHLVLKQSTSATEQVNSTCIDDLYYLSTVTGASALDNTSDIWGRINADQSTMDKVAALHSLDNSTPPVPVQSGNTGKWDNLFATATAYAIAFADPEVRSVIINSVFNGNAPTTNDVEDCGSSVTDPYNQLYTYRMPTALFANNTSILTFDELEYFINIGGVPDQMFQSCTNLTSVVLPTPKPGMTNYTLGWNTFYGCSSLSSITIPEGTNIIKPNCFKGTNITLLVLPSTITQLGGDAFGDQYTYKLTYVELRATTPPTIMNNGSVSNVFRKDNIIYVPSASLSTYQSTWSAISSRLAAIPE